MASGSADPAVILPMSAVELACRCGSAVRVSKIQGAAGHPVGLPSNVGQRMSAIADLLERDRSDAGRDELRGCSREATCDSAQHLAQWEEPAATGEAG